jgi:O-methyltransferase
LANGAAAGMPKDQDPVDLYLELLKRSLTHSLYPQGEMSQLWPRRPFDRLAARLLRRRGIAAFRQITEDDRARGGEWPLFAQTMIGTARLDNIRHCIESAIADGVPGNLIETGVWAGGATIFMRGVLAAHGVDDRTVWVADSFEGLPRPRPEEYPADAGARYHEAPPLSVPLEEVQESFRRYGLLDEQVRFLKGWFKDTLRTIPNPEWAVIRIDCDMYESTIDALSALYPDLSPGGYLIVDDYALEACRRAVDDFRRRHDVSEPIEHIDWTGIYWRRDASPGS